MIVRSLQERLEVHDDTSLQQYLDICSSHSTAAYTEEHHILPRSIFPEYEDLSQHPWNKVKLSYKDHIMAHYYFAKAVNLREMWAPLVLMLGETVGAIKSDTVDSILDKASILEIAKVKLRELPVSQETRDKLRIANLGKHHTNDARKKISSSKAGVPWTEKQRQRLQEEDYYLRGDDHWNHGRYPWQQARAVMCGSARLWLYAGDLYELWIEMGKPKCTTLRTRFRKTRSVDITNMDSIVNFFIKNGDPRLNAEWTQYVNGCNKEQ